MAPADILKKPYARLVIPDEDGTFSAEIVEFPGCIAVGSTPTDALVNLEETAIDWIAAALEQGQDIPEPIDSAGYSGKLVLRMTKGLHRKAALIAEREGASLNQFIVTCLAEAVGERAKPQTATVPLVQVEPRPTFRLVKSIQTGAARASNQKINGGPAFTIPALRVLEREDA